MIFNFDKAAPTPSLADLAVGHSAVIDALHLPPALADPLMDLGLVAGSRVHAVRNAPGGDPVIYRIDEAEIALRQETTRHITIQAIEASAECPR